MTNTRVFISLFDGQQFEKFSRGDAKDASTHVFCTIDGNEVEEVEWIRQQQAAIARDLARVFPPS